MIKLGLLITSFSLFTACLMAAVEDNVLIYSDSVQVTSEISSWEILTKNHPIKGTLTITHNDNLKIDAASAKIGNDPLQVKLVSEVILSPTSKLSLSIYEFELKGMEVGNYNLPPISVKVGNKVYQAPQLNVLIEP